MDDPEFDPRPILETLVRHEVDFVLVGGLAGTALGSAYVTYDVDVAYERSRENLQRLASALTEARRDVEGSPGRRPVPARR